MQEQTQTNPEPQEGANLLKADEVMMVLRCQRRKLYQLVDEGLFPSPVRFQGLVYWPKDEAELIVEGWIAGLPEEEQRDLVQRLLKRRQERFNRSLERLLPPQLHLVA